MPRNLSGIFTPLLVPYNTHGGIDEEELRRLVRWLIDKDVHGLYPNGSTGEFTRLTRDERQRVVQITCEVARGRVPVLAGAGEANVSETLTACETYAKYGARAAAIISPYYYRIGVESVYAYFAEIAANSPIDVILYNIPMFASPIDLPTIRRLAELPRIIGIKDATGDIAFMMRMISFVRPVRPDFTFLTGWDPVLVPMLRIGCDGGTLACSNAIPETMVRIFHLHRAGDSDEAMRLQYRMLPLFDTMLGHFEFPDGFRAATELRGFSFGHVRQPMTARQKKERIAQKEALRTMLTDLGVAELVALSD
jgi:dihydrodipicolinate synthase/N-acetylneuraminate lyase